MTSSFELRTIGGRRCVDRSTDADGVESIPHYFVPLSKPGLVAVAIVAFCGGAGTDYLLRCINNESVHYTDGLGISTLNKRQVIKLDKA